MNPFPPEQITAAQQANLASSFKLASHAFAAFEKLVELNLRVMRSTLTEMQSNTQKALEANTPHELLALQASLMQPLGEQVVAYCRNLYEIGAAAQAEVAKAAEAQYEANNRRVQGLMENVATSAPSGSEGAFTALTSVITATNNLCESMYQTAKQVVEVAESNFNSANTAASKTAKQVAEHTSRAART